MISSARRLASPPSKRAKRARTGGWYVRPGPEGELSLPNDEGRIVYARDFLSCSEADELFSQTRDARSWQRTPITIFGKTVLQPRDTAFFGTRLYSYSDERREPTGWDEDPPASIALRKLATRIEDRLELPHDYFNVVLANRYNHGRDFMGWHADNEKSLGDEPIIASISLGAERRFLVRRKPSLCTTRETNHKDQREEQDEHSELASQEKIAYLLAHGSLFVMSGKMQKFYQHSLPKVSRSKCDDMRLNFTFRRVLDDTDHRKV